MTRRLVAVVSAGLAAGVLSACAAVTRPATNVGSTTATLNARGHTSDTPGHYEFQYGTAEAALGTGSGYQTPTRGPIPPHSTAAFSENVSGLSTGTTYFFRVCGGDGQVHPDVCLNTRSFTTSVPGATVAFAPPVSYPVHSQPAGVVIANLQGPASRDIVTVNPSTNDVSVLLNHGDGVYAAAVNYPAGTGPTGIAAGNFTGAGRRDIVTIDSTGLSVLLGDGHGGLGAPDHIALPGPPQTLALGDFNGDGHQDIATFEDLPGTPNPNEPYLPGNSPAGVVTVLPGHGDGTFGNPISTTIISAQPCGVHGVCPTAEDVTLAAGALQAGVPRTDLVLGGTLYEHDSYTNEDTEPSIHDALLANGDGTFTVTGIAVPPAPATVGPPYGGIAGEALGDLNGDGSLDEAFLNAYRVVEYSSSGQVTGGIINTIQTSIGKGDGTFEDPTTAATLPTSQVALPLRGTLRVAAITSPARRDLVSLLPPASTLTVTPSTGPDTFGTPVTIGPGESFDDVVAADVNHDGKADLVAAGSGSDVAVFDNASPGG